MNLFLLVSAPAASGKGVLAFVRMMGERINNNFNEKYREELACYEAIPPEEKKDAFRPIHKKLFIPGNNTSASMINSINNNEIFGLIYDTEADTITNANKSEHGNFSELLRKAFHHETIEYERKTNKEYITIPNPALSILISGTPRQVGYLMKDVENGLTSRFIFYNYSVQGGWRDVFGSTNDISYKFKNAGIELEMLTRPYFEDFIDNQNGEVLFSFSSQQQELFRMFFQAKYTSIEHLYGQDMRSAITRLGLIFFRIAMVLTVIRTLGDEPGLKKKLPLKLECEDVDFEITAKIISSLLHHSVSIYHLLKKNAPGMINRNIKMLFLQRLPDKFTRQVAMEIAELMQIKEKTAENYISQFIVMGLLERVSQNNYIKP